MADEPSQQPLPEAARRSLLVAVVAVPVLIALYLAGVFLHGDGVRPGSVVQGVEIGGLSQAEAVARLEETIGVTAAKPLRIKDGSQVFEIAPKAAGLTFDAEATVQAASGREWSPFAIIGLFGGERPVDPVISVDEAMLHAQVAGVAASIDSPAVEPTLIMRGMTPVAKKGKDGQGVDQDALAQTLEDAFIVKRTPITAPIVAVPPAVTPEAVQQAKELAATAVAAPVVVRAGDITATINAGSIAKALTFTVEGDQLVPVLNGAVLHKSIKRELKSVETPGRDATFKIKDGKPVVVPSVVGTGITDDELASQVLGVLGNPLGDREVSVSLGVREPELTTAQAEQLGVTERISTFTQKFPYAAYRVQNIGQAAKYINGTLLLPGETFSMNDTVKERTEANGYTVGFIIGQGGVFEEDWGGGVSAAATTMWTGAFFAGLERVSTTAHSIYISRYQPGLEATVLWGNFDMSFRNNTPYGVFITTSMTNTSMTVNFWSTRIYDEVKAEFGPRMNVRPYSTIYDKSDKCLGQGGTDGFTIDVDRVFINDGVEQRRETITTTYKPSPEVICGKKPKKDKGKKKADATAPSPGATPSPSPTDEATDKASGKASPKATDKASGKATAKATAKASPSPSPSKKKSAAASADEDAPDPAKKDRKE